MKILMLIALMVVNWHGAVAETSDCSKVPKASDRLACYDRGAPPSVTKPTTSKQRAAAPNISTDQGSVIDGLAVENERLGAKLKMICRGC
jgi:hypothetical protein